MIESRGLSCWRRATTRPLAAGFVAFVLLLQTLAALGVSHAHRGLAGVEAGFASSSTVDGPCAADSSSQTPGRHEGDGRPPCCLFCPASGFGGLPILHANETSAGAVRRSKAILSIALFYDAPNAPPTGWATSWSSQAPPLFS